MKKNVHLLSLCCLLILFITPVAAQWSASMVPYGRTGNSVRVISNSVVAITGGNETNDSLRSVFISKERGVNFYVNLDVFGPWLKSGWFFSDTTGIVVGQFGAILKTTDGATFTPVQPPVNAASRHFNSVFFVNSQVGYIVGGWPANDSIQTILKTTDGGNTWSIQRDNLGYWLKSVYFFNANNGMATGENGVILKTTDGGANWVPLTVSGNAGSRFFNAVYMTDSLTAIVVGGNPSNDSIQTILRTTDGGANWNILLDNLGGMLNAIDFSNLTNGYIVGNEGAMLGTTDAGASWAPLNLPFSINDTIDLYSVDFYNSDFGVATGVLGKMLIYDNPLPAIVTKPATHVTTGSAQLNADVNLQGGFVAVNFELGTTTQFGTNYVATPDTVFGDTSTSVIKILTGLAANTVYYYRAVGINASGTFYGDTKQFFTGGCDIPNCSFEFWDTITTDHPAVWHYAGAPKKVSSYNGTFAVELSGNSTKPEAAVIMGNIESDQFPPPGGLPFNQRPDSLLLMAKYSIAAGDTGFAVVFFTKQTQTIYGAMFPITGSSGGSFVPLSFPLNFPTADVPDTLVIGFINTNGFSDNPNPNSTLTIDDVHFAGANGNLPNWDFEQWATDTSDFVELWLSDEDNGDNPGLNTNEKTTDAIDGNYALKLINHTGARPARISTDYDKDYNSPDFPVGGRHLTFDFYYKYFPQNTDSFSVQLQMYKAGQPIGNAWMLTDSTVANYTKVSLVINYSNNDIPDSASISISLGSEWAHGNSIAYIDDLAFDAPTVAINPVAGESPQFLLFPNPANSAVTVAWGTAIASPQITLSDTRGRILQQFTPAVGATQTVLNTSGLASGIYLLSVRAQGQSSTKKLIIGQ